MLLLKVTVNKQMTIFGVNITTTLTLDLKIFEQVDNIVNNSFYTIPLFNIKFNKNVATVLAN